MTNPTDPHAFDGCNSECRKAGAHTLRWGGCEHAPKPEPTVSMSVVYTDPEDGHPSIGFDTYTVAELADLIAPALLMPEEGFPPPYSESYARALAIVAAKAIVHRNDDPATAVPSAPTTQTADADRRDRYAQAIRDSNGTLEALAWWQAHPQLIPAAVYADAAMAVADAEQVTARGATLREAADGFDAHAEKLLRNIDDMAVFVAKARQHEAATWREAAETLRRMADEEQQPETQATADTALIARVREWVTSDVVTARSEFGDGYRAAQRDIRDLIKGRFDRITKTTERFSLADLDEDAPPPAPLRRSEEDCPGFPERCPNLRPVDPNPPQHYGGIRCGCADEEPRS